MSSKFLKLVAKGVLASVLFGGIVSADDRTLPVRGLCIAAPTPERLDDFIAFIHKEMAPRSVNTLVLRVDYDYQYEGHPELRDGAALSKQDVRRLVVACKTDGIRIIPQVNLLGHQSWAGKPNRLLQVYPDFDETPWVKLKGELEWPNPERLYCKSYCPLHPKVHDIVFSIVDELCDAFEADAFHAGMDEVFYLAEYRCPRCGGRDPAQLFAGEVKLIRDHLAEHKRSLWIWGDRLLDGKTTGLGEWEASYNNTHRALDLIPKDVMICDWHYERPEPTAVVFAMKGLQVLSCPWNRPEPAEQQVKDVFRLRKYATPEMRQCYQGMLQTVWSEAGTFMDDFYGKIKPEKDDEAACFRATFAEIQEQGR